MIETARLLLRQWRDEDREMFAAMCSDRIVMEHVGGPVSRKECDEGIDRQIELISAQGLGFFAVECRSNRTFIGFVGMGRVSFEAPFKGEWEVGWRLAHLHWGRGYASEAAHAVLNYGFRAKEIKRSLAFTKPANAKSQAVMHRLGMRRLIDGDFSHPDEPFPLHLLYEANAENWPL